MMMNKEQEYVVFQEDCDALLIPHATPITIPAGTEVIITQALGGTYTVFLNGNLARIEGKDAPKMGKEIPATPELADLDGEASLEDFAWATLKTIYDPEIPLNIVDLGLVYNIRIDPLKQGGHKASIVMTLTAPGCAMGPVLIIDVEQSLRNISGIEDVKVELVFDPPWNREMISEEARLSLGLL